MKKRYCLLLIITVLLCVFANSTADGWIVPNNHHRCSDSNQSAHDVIVQLIDDMATRSGPSTSYTGCGSYKMKGQYVKALSRAYDNGGVLWIEVEFTYGGGYRRAWTGAKRLDINAEQLLLIPEEDTNFWLGYGTICSNTSSRYGPGCLFSTYADRDFYIGDQAAVIRYENGFYLIECYHTDNHVFRSWISEESISW